MIVLNCGCEVEDYEDTVDIRMKSEGICIFDGVVPSVEHKTVCKFCYEDKYSHYAELILTDKEEMKWLNTKFK